MNATAADEPQESKRLANQPVKDKEYFLEDGDCVFIVEGTLFKLHKWSLCRDPESMFHGMFSLPQITSALSMDPIPLSDTADDFRALCWALYALPCEIQDQNDSGTDISRLVAVANMSHKYSLPQFEKWALGMIWQHFQPRGDYLNDCSQNMLDTMYDLTADGKHEGLCSLVKAKWLSRLKSGELQLRHALDFGEAHNMRQFLADAYYQQALDMKSFMPKLVNGSEVADFSTLTRAQADRLIYGCCSLRMFWETFCNTVLPGCLAYDHNGNMNELTDIGNSLNVVERLQLAKGSAANYYYNCGCRRDYIDLLISGFALENHFLL
ncbi:hypothetical protein C8F04DRAFT_1119445 [Mycena alexandri]|uniref:BTB domain-containing protein n=1 Tax=Mycena alexandri TaxID=1745969 RepID=A0AAD6SJ14_9AGAR|nr:hypothetical protein C8F04DRAFT_1119445 [Mycena alexandri]